MTVGTSSANLSGSADAAPLLAPATDAPATGAASTDLAPTAAPATDLASTDPAGTDLTTTAATATDADSTDPATTDAPATDAASAELASVATGGRISRALWCVVGFVAVGFGGLGVIVPGLPTTVFFIIAAWCFSHGSPRFEKWVLDLPAIGPMVRDHRLGLGMPRRIKVVANAMMWTAIVISGIALHSMPWVVAGIVSLGTIGTIYIVFQVPTRETELARRAALAEAGL